MIKKILSWPCIPVFEKPGKGNREEKKKLFPNSELQLCNQTPWHPGGPEQMRLYKERVLMNRSFALVAVLGFAVVISSVQGDDKDKLPTVKAIMKATHGKGGFREKTSAALKEKDFAKVGEVAKEWEKCAVAMEKNTPTKGEKESWAKLTAAYTKAIKTLGEAAEGKDAKKAAGALGYVGSSCGACHKSHK